MLPELGQFCLVLALCIAAAQTVFPLAGAHRGNVAWMAVAMPAAAGQFVFVALSFGFLTYAFVTNDFSVLIVASHSNSELPLLYRVAAVWGGHEGSLLLWMLLLSGWTLAVVVSGRHLPEDIYARIVGVMGFISTGLMLYILSVSNPFLRLSPVPFDGNDLNPLLQDPAMALHPPILYTGYVGFSVAFAFAVAAMLAGRIDQAWARWARPWTTAAWLFLTMGIALGSWWAYYELGWGGWWFWDPVENASFMPWLVGTALIHSLAVTEKRGLFKGSTLLLAISAFSLSLLGTFLVRSGVLVSVHAFASDPSRGIFILALLAVVIGGALSLYAWRAPGLDREVGFKPFSRETFLMINNILLCIAAFLILLGTLYPLILDAMNAGKISVGKPYFDNVFLVPMLPLLFAVGVGMHVAWRDDDAGKVAKRLRLAAAAAVVMGLAVPLIGWGVAPLLSVIGMIAGCWLIVAALRDPLLALSGKAPRLTRAMLGMQFAHAGVGLFVIGVTATNSFGIAADQRVGLGETIEVAGYQIHFDGLKQVEGPNYRALRATIDVARDGKPVARLLPEKRIYRVQTSPMTEASIDDRWSRHLFVALGDDLGEGAWSIRVQYKPLIRLIWFGCLVMALGGAIAVSDRRYRVRTALSAKTDDKSASALQTN
ncbi:MAG: heme lyase CcmF/NrfE family subunit [Gammaproteobacteria bacterium]